MAQSENDMERYEYVPMSTPYINRRPSYGIAEGVGVHTMSSLRGHVTIHEHAPRQVEVSVFASLGVTRTSPNSYQQATVKLVKGDNVLATKIVTKKDPHIIATHDIDQYMGSATLDLPLPVDAAPLHVTISAMASAHFPAGSVSGPTLVVDVPLAVRKAVTP
jgi:hypothetical protein